MKGFVRDERIPPSTARTYLVDPRCTNTRTHTCYLFGFLCRFFVGQQRTDTKGTIDKVLDVYLNRVVNVYIYVLRLLHSMFSIYLATPLLLSSIFVCVVDVIV